MREVSGAGDTRENTEQRREQCVVLRCVCAGCGGSLVCGGATRRDVSFFNSKLHNPVLRRSGKPPLLLDSHACALPVSTPPPTVSHLHTSPQPHPPALSPALLPYVKALHTQTPSTLTLEKTHNSHLSLSLATTTHTRLVAHPITHIKLPSARPIIIG